MDKQQIIDQANELAAQAQQLADTIGSSAVEAAPAVASVAEATGTTPFVFLFTAFVLACFVGYMVIWNVTPSLHTPLMSVTNAISSIIIIGALLQISSPSPWVMWLSGIAVLITAVNIVGGFSVTRRMLKMFQK